MIIYSFEVVADCAVLRRKVLLEMVSVINTVGMSLGRFWERVEDSGVWCAVVYEVANSWIQLSN